MKMHIRYRLIQILEIPLWLGAVAGIGMVARDAWALREQGASAMLNAAGPGLLAIGAAMAALIVLIGIYHNSRRSAEAMDRLSRQGNGGMRRLPGAHRHDVPQPAPQPVAAVAPQPAPMMAPPPTPMPVPVAAPVIAAPAPQPVAPPAPAPAQPPAPVFSTPVAAEPEPAPIPPHIVASTPAPQPEPARAERPAMRAGLRRLGPAN